MDNKRIKKDIERLRIEKNLSQSEIAEMLGISQPSFHKIEKGKTLLFNEHLGKICTLLGVSEEELLFGKYPSDGSKSRTLEDSSEARKQESEDHIELQKLLSENEELKRLLKIKEERISELNTYIKDKETIINILFEKSELQKNLIEILREKFNNSRENF